MTFQTCQHCGREKIPPLFPVCPVCKQKLTRPSKYGNIKVKADGYTFDSKWEHVVYLSYRDRESRGEVRNIRVHPRYVFVVNNVEIGSYRPDLDCEALSKSGEWKLEVIDAKSAPTITRDYRFCRQLMLALYGIRVKEILRNPSSKPRGKRR